MRVVSETAIALWLINDFAVPTAFGNDGFGIVGMANGHQNACVVSVAIGFVFEFFNQKGVVFRVI